MANAAIVVDSYDSALIEAGDIIIPLNEGVITRSNIHATIAELVSGIKALPDAGDRITVFKSAGIAMEDLVAADIAYRKAIELGLGTSVSL
jgi:ornithine cyclodeaminase/alanine dehydrogenase